MLISQTNVSSGQFKVLFKLSLVEAVKEEDFNAMVLKH